MNNFGIIRKIDELGRIVIPKEMRYKLGIRNGEPLNLFIENNNLIITKYSEIESISEISNNLCNIINDICDVDVIITDRDKIIATSKNLKNNIINRLDDFYKTLIDNREHYISEIKENKFNLTGYFIIFPIITTLDCTGLVIIRSDSFNKDNIMLVKLVSRIIANKLDIAL